MQDPSLIGSRAGLNHLLHHAAFALVTTRAFLRVSGPDATRWLNGMVTNAAHALAPGEGNYNFLLNAQGRIQGDCLIFREPNVEVEPVFLLATEAPQIDAIHQHLDRFIIMDDVELTRACEDETTLLLLGQDAPRHLAALDLPKLDPLHLAHADTPHGPVLLLTSPPAQIPRFELRASAATIATIQDQLAQRGLTETSATTLEQLRILEGTPRFGTDIRNSETAHELPQETNQTHALHFAKGCYLGQEIVERIRSRGQVHRTFTGFRLEGPLPELPAALASNGKPVGELTSAAEMPPNGEPSVLALGYVRREALETGAVLTYEGGIAHPRRLRQPG